mgnify:CR=1 FL=1
MTPDRIDWPTFFAQAAVVLVILAILALLWATLPDRPFVAE